MEPTRRAQPFPLRVATVGRGPIRRPVAPGTRPEGIATPRLGPAEKAGRSAALVRFVHSPRGPGGAFHSSRLALARAGGGYPVPPGSPPEALPPPRAPMTNAAAPAKRAGPPQHR